MQTKEEIPTYEIEKLSSEDMKKVLKNVMQSTGRPGLNKVIEELIKQSRIKKITNPEIKKGIETLRSILDDTSQHEALCDELFYEEYNSECRDWFN